MTRAQPIDRDEFFETAKLLQAEGKEVTANNMLRALGRGSMRTIYKFYDEWKAELPAPVAIASSQVPDNVRLQYEVAWRAAQEEAARQVEAVKLKAAEDVQAAEKRFADALEITDKMERDAEEAAEQILSLTTTVRQLNEKVRSLESESERNKATAEQLGQQVKAQQQEIERLHKRSEEDRQQHTEQIKKLEAMAEKSKELHDKEAVALKSSLSEVQSKLSQVEKERDGAKTKADEAAKQQEKSEATAKSDRTERDAAIKEAAALTGQVAALKEQYTQLMAKLNSEEKPEKKK